LKILIASDSFKGSATTYEVAGFIEKGIRRVDENAEVTKLPLADGGEGTVEALIPALEGQYFEETVTGPLGQKVRAKFGIINKDIAIIEMAAASGITLISREERNPFKTTTYGTGELIKAALDHGVKEILIGIGGSATNDGGVGMAQALGVSFKDSQGQEVGFGAASLADIKKIDVSNLDPRIKNTKISILSDVTNPLYGENGASYVYGPQKGASPDDVLKLDAILQEFGDFVEKELAFQVVNLQGAGAAGGLGFGLIAFCNGKMYSGIERILDIIHLEEHVKDADFVITGEGMMDFQSVQGKAPLGVAKIAKKYDVPVIAIVGSEGLHVNRVYDHGIDLVIDIINKPMSLEEAISNVEELVVNAGEKAMRAFCLHR
jgi:glycerate 2-kinase